MHYKDDLGKYSELLNKLFNDVGVNIFEETDVLPIPTELSTENNEVKRPKNKCKIIQFYK